MRLLSGTGQELCCVFFFFQAEDGIRDLTVTGVQTCALPISPRRLRGGPTGCGLRLAPPAFYSDPKEPLLANQRERRNSFVTRFLAKRSFGDEIGRASCRERV